MLESPVLGICLVMGLVLNPYFDSETLELTQSIHTHFRPQVTDSRASPAVPVSVARGLLLTGHLESGWSDADWAAPNNPLYWGGGAQS